MNTNFILLISFILATAASSCAYHVEEELYPDGVCDTLNVTYSGTVLPIIQQNCYECHSNENVQLSLIPLEGYSNIIIKINDGKLVRAIRHQSNVSAMPKDRPALAECDILKIEKWVSLGAPDN